MQPYVISQSIAPEMPVTKTRVTILARYLLLLFKGYEQLCLHEAILTYYIGTSAIWSGGQAVP